jgi:hypothetical protein
MLLKEYWTFNIINKTQIMNILDHYVTEIISEPYLKNDNWCIDVKASCYGVRKHTLTFKTKEECLNVKINYMFLA